MDYEGYFNRYLSQRPSVWKTADGILKSPERSLREEYLRHNQELRKIRKFIRNKGASNVFEKNYLASVEQFLERAQYAVKLLDETDYDDLRERAWREGQVCHGEYNQHNILMLKGDHLGTAVTNFGHWSFDIQVADREQCSGVCNF